MLRTLHRLDAAAESAPETSDGACQLLVRRNSDVANLKGLWTGHEAAKGVHSDSTRLSVGADNGTAPAQAPFAAILGCADARVPPEIVFNLGSNKMFVVRVAGNGLGQEGLGSLRYAVSHFPATLKLLVVLGHTNCGAVTAAVDAYLYPHKYIDIATDYSVRGIEDQIFLAVRIAAMSLESLHGGTATKQPGARAALVEAAVVVNAAWSAYCLRQEFKDTFPDLGVVFGAYDLISGHVRLPLSLPGQLREAEKGLFVPPKDAAGFRQLALRLCKGQLIRSLMAPERRQAS